MSEPNVKPNVSNTPLFRHTILKAERDLMSEPNVKPNVKQKFRLKEDVVPSVFTFCEAKEKCRSIILTNAKARNEILQPIRREESDQTNDESLLTPMEKWIGPDNEKVPELSSEDEISLDEHDVSFQETKNISYKMIWGCLFRGCSWRCCFSIAFFCSALSEIIRVHAKGIVVVLKLECIQIHEVYWSSHSEEIQ